MTDRVGCRTITIKRNRRGVLFFAALVGLSAALGSPVLAQQRPVLVPQTGHTDAVMSVAFSPDGRTLASGSFDHTVILWDPATGAQKQRLTGRGDLVWSVAFSPDGKAVASGSGDGRVILRDLATGARESTLEGHTDQVTSVASARMARPWPRGARTAR